MYWAPGIPHALYRAEEFCKTRARRAARSRTRICLLFENLIREDCARNATDNAPAGDPGAAATPTSWQPSSSPGSITSLISMYTAVFTGPNPIDAITWKTWKQKAVDPLSHFSAGLARATTRTEAGAGTSHDGWWSGAGHRRWAGD